MKIKQTSILSFFIHLLQSLAKELGSEMSTLTWLEFVPFWEDYGQPNLLSSFWLSLNLGHWDRMFVFLHFVCIHFARGSVCCFTFVTSNNSNLGTLKWPCHKVASTGRTPYSRLVRLRWLREHSPDIREKSLQTLMVILSGIFPKPGVWSILQDLTCNTEFVKTWSKVSLSTFRQVLMLCGAPFLMMAIVQKWQLRYCPHLYGISSCPGRS